MQIRNINFFTTPNLKFQQRNYITPIKSDSFTLSFKGMKKQDFKGLDYAVVEKFSAPVQQFKTREDFNSWAKKKIQEDYLSRDFSAKTLEATAQRIAIIDDWHKYLTTPNSAYIENPAWELLILESITKNLKPNTDKIPPALNQGALAATIEHMQQILAEKPKTQLNFAKIYGEKINEMYAILAQESSNTETEGVWVKIPSKIHDEQNFEANVDKLKALSHPNWCTKSTNAQPYLSEGDFHVYLVGGKPKVGIRFYEDEIEEIQGPRNNGAIPIIYADVIGEYVSANNFKGKEKEIETAKLDYQDFLKVKEELADAIEKKDFIEILNHPAFNCNARRKKNGLLKLDSYIPISIPYTLTDLGIDENELFDCIEEINEPNVVFSYTNVTRLKNLKTLGGNVNFTYSQIQDTGSLETVYGKMFVDVSKVKLNDNLKSVGTIGNGKGSNINIQRYPEYLTAIKKAQKIKTKEEIFEFLGIEYKKLENGTYQIKEYKPFESANFCYLKDFCKDGDVFKIFGMTHEEFLSDISVVEGDVDLFTMQNIENLGGIEVIGGDLNINCTQMESLGKVKHIKGNLFAKNNSLASLGVLERVDGEIMMRNSHTLESLGELTYVGKSADFANSSVRDTGKLKYVGEDLDFGRSSIEKADSIEHIGGKFIISQFTYSLLWDELGDKGFNLKLFIR